MLKSTFLLRRAIPALLLASTSVTASAANASLFLFMESLNWLKVHPHVVRCARRMLSDMKCRSLACQREVKQILAALAGPAKPGAGLSGSLALLRY